MTDAGGWPIFAGSRMSEAAPAPCWKVLGELEPDLLKTVREAKVRLGILPNYKKIFDHTED
jgi:hypothetical protein